MYTCIYREKKTMEPWGTGIIGYLNEEIVKDYQPEATMENEQPEKFDGYQYTGTVEDGGTIMPDVDMNDYGSVANGIIRSKYSQSEENAIHRHHMNGGDEYAEEWDAYNDFCEKAKTIAKEWVEKQNA